MLLDRIEEPNPIPTTDPTTDYNFFQKVRLSHFASVASKTLWQETKTGLDFI